MASYPGLSAAEVAERVQRGQTNNFEARSGRSYLQIVRDNVFNLFNIILFSLLLTVFISKTTRGCTPISRAFSSHKRRVQKVFASMIIGISCSAAVAMLY